MRPNRIGTRHLKATVGEPPGGIVRYGCRRDDPMPWLRSGMRVRATFQEASVRFWLDKRDGLWVKRRGHQQDDGPA